MDRRIDEGLPKLWEGEKGIHKSTENQRVESNGNWDVVVAKAPAVDGVLVKYVFII